MKTNLIGRHVIVRSNMAGVFFGILAEKNGVELTLKDARKFYYFSGANTVEDLATEGALNVRETQLTVSVEVLVLSSFDQMIPCTENAISQIKTIPVWKFQN